MLCPCSNNNTYGTVYTTHTQTCMRMRTSAECLRWKRWLENSRRACSTSARCSGVPKSRSNSHTVRPTKPFVDRSKGLPPSATFSFHMCLCYACKGGMHCNQTKREIDARLFKRESEETRNKQVNGFSLESFLKKFLRLV